MRIMMVFASRLPQWSSSADLWHLAACRLIQNGSKVACLVPAADSGLAHLASLRDQGVDVLFWDRSQTLLEKLRRKVDSNQLSKSLRAAVEWKPDLVLIWSSTPIDGLDWIEFCQKAKLPYSTAIEANSPLWWPEDDLADSMYKLFSGAEQIFLFSGPNKRQLELQLACPLESAKIIWDAYERAPSGPIPENLQSWALATLDPPDPAKNALDVLFQVLAKPSWRERPLCLNVYGVSGSIDTLRMLARRLDLASVHFRGGGFSSSEIWRENHLLVHAARYEGFPGRLIESMWHQRPAVVTELVAGENLYENGETAFVAEAPRVQLLDAALEEAWQRRHEWPKMGTGAQAAIKKFAPIDPVGAFCQVLVESSK
jgi:glycosyltransferase involved in cell wall biosynthesis